MRRSALLVLIVLTIYPFAVAGIPETVAGPISARVLRVIDGDTIVVHARIWLGQDIDV